jgi:hypothetical protein
MQPTQLFGRSWNITVGDVEVSSGPATGALACEFSVRKTLKAEPNVCSLRVYNLSEETRTKLTSPKKIVVRIEAGYGTRVSQIYLGDVRALTPGEITPTGDVITDLESGDGEKACASAHLSVPIGGKGPAGDSLRAIAKALGVGLGNTAQMAAQLSAKGVAVFPRTTVLSGNVARHLTDFCRSAGLEWSIQDGALQILDLAGALNVKPYIIAPDSGLIGSPKMGNDGNVTLQTLMIPELRPGLRVQLDSFSVKGLYRIDQAEYSGQTHGEDWTIKLTCSAPKAKK